MQVTGSMSKKDILDMVIALGGNRIPASSRGQEHVNRRTALSRPHNPSVGRDLIIGDVLDAREARQRIWDTVYE